jgi:uncharacterized membrane protein
LTGLQPNLRGSRRREARAFGAGALLCLILLALLTVVQVTHIHALESNADQCPLCIAMQSAAPVAAIAAVVVLIRIQAAAQVYEARAVVRYWSPKLFTRPPPAGC